jgi:nucleoside-diphosphate-sugar epimerase
VVRPTHTYDPTIDLKDSRLFSEFVADVVAERNIVMKSDGTPVRTFCYISDATTAYFKVLLDAPGGEAYGVRNSDYQMSVYELAELLVRLSGNPDLRVIKRKRAKDDPYMESPQPANSPIFSSEKIRRLGWADRVGIEASVELWPIFTR